MGKRLAQHWFEGGESHTHHKRTNLPQPICTGLSTMHLRAVHCRSTRGGVEEGGRNLDSASGSDPFQVHAADLFNWLMIVLPLALPGRPLFFCSCLGLPPWNCSQTWYMLHNLCCCVYAMCMALKNVCMFVLFHLGITGVAEVKGVYVGIVGGHINSKSLQELDFVYCH